MKDRSAEYEAANGWSSKLFAPTAVSLMQELKARRIKIVVGRSVIHIGDTIKAYVHHNGRSAEHATFTDWHGNELATFHHTEHERLKAFVHGRFK